MNPNGQTISVCGNTFRLDATIGRGSYGTVHRAVNVTSNVPVAIKVISKDKLKRPHERRSIEKEIETMLVAVEQYENGHPHIVRLLCTKESQHNIFIVLEFCGGGDIATYIKKCGGLTEDQAKMYMSHLAAGLQFLRSQNVIHRDLKPANLLLTSVDMMVAKLKIADFGFARELQSESMAESVVGSPLYMAPELLEFKSYDAKADLWSVGIILYEMIANDHPFLVVNNQHASNHLALRRNIIKYFEKQNNVVLPANAVVSQDCADLIAGLLKPNPKERISFEEFFNATFLLPPVPTQEDSIKVKDVQHALMFASQDDLADSDEYVIVEREYEDVGRHVLNGEDDQSMEFDCLDASETLSPRVATNDETLSVPPVPSSTADTKHKIENISNASSEADKIVIPKVQTTFYDEASSLEEALGISYKRFAIGNVALFVPTPRGDYIAFHENNPHYYLSSESIEASKCDGKKPAYVLGCIVFIESQETEEHCNPYHLKIGTTYHTVMVSVLPNRTSNTPVEKVNTPSPMFRIASSAAQLSPAKPTNTPSGTKHHQRISFRSFQIRDLALFFQKSGKQTYLAFNEGSPNYYLADESIRASLEANGNTFPTYIIGEIIFIDSFQATEDLNPHRLNYGTRFFIVTVDLR